MSTVSIYRLYLRAVVAAPSKVNWAPDLSGDTRQLIPDREPDPLGTSAYARSRADIQATRLFVASSSTRTRRTPRALFRDLPRDPDVKFLWAHQDRVLEAYEGLTSVQDLALELPTGTGKIRRAGRSVRTRSTFTGCDPVSWRSLL
jgi:hypothetical protein